MSLLEGKGFFVFLGFLKVLGSEGSFETGPQNLREQPQGKTPGLLLGQGLEKLPEKGSGSGAAAWL